jgi:hypothetical protein
LLRGKLIASGFNGIYVLRLPAGAARRARQPPAHLVANASVRELAGRGSPVRLTATTIDRVREDAMRLVARAVVWLHVTLYRPTNGRIGGRFIAGSPILLLTTTGRRNRQAPHPPPGLRS